MPEVNHLVTMFKTISISTFHASATTVRNAEVTAFVIAVNASAILSSAERPASALICKRIVSHPTAIKCARDMENATATSANATHRISESFARALRAMKASTLFASFMSPAFSV